MMLPESRASLPSPPNRRVRMPTLPHLLFGAAIALLIAITMVLLLPGSGPSHQQEAYLSGLPSASMDADQRPTGR